MSLCSLLSVACILVLPAESPASVFLLLSDLNYNRCDIPEESWTGCESDVAYASYVPGSIVWAKQYGYPW